MKRRSYGQYCGLATAFDIIGERWTALLVRDLAISDKRFGELLAGLPGLGTSLLSERLRHLEEEGLVVRVVADRAEGGGVMYRLTDEGLVVARALAPLAVWGATRLPESGGDQFDPGWLMFVLQSSIRRPVPRSIDDCYEFQINGHKFWVTVSGGAVSVTTAPPRKPDFVAALELRDLAGIGDGSVDPLEAVQAGRAKFDGDADAGWRALHLLGSVAETGGELTSKRKGKRSSSKRRN